MKKILSLTFIAVSLLFTVVISQNIVRGPYLQMGTPNSIVLKWKTNVATDSRVKYGTEPGNLSGSVNLPQSEILHEVKISGLKPNTKYYYSVGSASTVLQGNQDNYFITSPEPGTKKSTRIWVIGDAGTGTAGQNQVRDAYYKYTGTTPTDVWLWLGDNAYQDGKESEYDANVFVNHYEKMFKQTVAWPAAGNHDMRSANASSQTGPYYDLFTLPKNGEAGGVPSGTEAYYSFNYSNIHFICLESTTASFRATSSAMVSWLKNDLAANNQKFTIVYFHHPPYTKGSHNSDSEIELVEMRENIVPIMEQYQVDLVLSGHSHSYERSFMIKGHYGVESTFTESMKVSKSTAEGFYNKALDSRDGTVYAVAGNSGKLSGTTAGWPHNCMTYSSNTILGSMVIDVKGDTLEAKFIDNNTSNPTVQDKFVIVKASAPGNNPGPTEPPTPPVTGIEDVRPKSYKVNAYPNPTKGEILLEALTRETKGKLEILNTIGQVVYKQDLTIENDAFREKINIGEKFSAGIYIVSVKLGEQVQNIKVMLTK